MFRLTLSLLILSLLVRSLVLVLSQGDLKDDLISDAYSSPDSPLEWDEFGYSDFKPDNELDPGSWCAIFEPDSSVLDTTEDPVMAEYYSAVKKMLWAVSRGEVRMMQEAAVEIEAAAVTGNPHAQSGLGFLYGLGQMRERNEDKAVLYHYFAAEGGNLQSKMVLAYTYSRQDMYDKAVNLYAELAEVAVKSFWISKDSPVIEPAQKGNAEAMYKIGQFYYFGLRGLRRDQAKALSWFSEAVKKGEPRSMELLGEIYARGAGVERNYTKAIGCFKLASEQQLYSAYNGMGYLFVKGYGVEMNYTKAKEYFEKAADNEEAAGRYNLGVMYLKGIGVKRDVKLACKYFIEAANAGQPKAFYQLAKMFHMGVGLKKDLIMGPWSTLSRWALESYLKGDVGKAFLLYSRMAELGYEIAQSNAAWILDKYEEHSMCMGESGFCTDTQRHQRAFSFGGKLLSRGMERDYERAAEAYMHAKSQSNAQAMFNLGYMHEHGQGLPFDLHLAQRYYDQAQEVKMMGSSEWCRPFLNMSNGVELGMAPSC
ncbi:hypothetical protein GH714_023543 [Hevea brasiliensis]|uniref:DOD-type homing endonuclease domain-containing protein n=1 Tax=Hevea brasiliensis TaxID=3981 RepID=A0A6A6LBN5_HEVBR|nr:hypothetical protein GH714_023543 [Hevea brasiliensis]